jgi:radical SAM-linked protein
MWERALRRAGLKVAYTEGFSPRPKVHFGLALSTGHESMAEYIDIDLVEDVVVEPLLALLSNALPVGLEVTAGAVIERSAASLQADVAFCSWVFTMRNTSSAEAETAVARLVAADTAMLTRSRKGVESTDDVRPAIRALAVDANDSVVCILAELATTGRGLRPNELVQVLFPEDDDVEARIGSVLRTHQWIEADGARVEPLPLAATQATHTEVCV